MLQKISYKIIIYCIFQSIFFSNLQFCHPIRHQFEHNNNIKYEIMCTSSLTRIVGLVFERMFFFCLLVVKFRSICSLDYRYCTITRTGTKAIYTTFNYGSFSRLFFNFQTRAQQKKNNNFCSCVDQFDFGI